MKLKSILLSSIVCVLFAQSNTNIGSSLLSKSGSTNSRVWNFNFINSGPDTAVGAQVDSFTLTQTSGTTCTTNPVVSNSFPISLGDVGPGYATAGYSVTIDFSGCSNNARFTLITTLEANNGTTTSTVPRYNQFQ